MKSRSSFENFSQVVNKIWFTFAFTLLRVVVGFEFLMAGLAKFGGWTAAGYLSGATGPFATVFQSMSGSILVDQLNIWGLTLIGLALIIGLLVRPASFFGVVMMTLYYFAQFVENTSHGLIDNHVILVCVFILFMAGGTGHSTGVDGIISRNIRKKKWWKTILFG